MVSQVWEGVTRMTALAKQTTQSFLEGSVVLGPPLPGVRFETDLLVHMHCLV